MTNNYDLLSFDIINQDNIDSNNNKSNNKNNIIRKKDNNIFDDTRSYDIIDNNLEQENNYSSEFENDSFDNDSNVEFNGDSIINIDDYNDNKKININDSNSSNSNYNKNDKLDNIKLNNNYNIIMNNNKDDNLDENDFKIDLDSDEYSVEIKNKKISKLTKPRKLNKLEIENEKILNKENYIHDDYEDEYNIDKIYYDNPNLNEELYKYSSSENKEDSINIENDDLYSELDDHSILSAITDESNEFLTSPNTIEKVACDNIVNDDNKSTIIIPYSGTITSLNNEQSYGFGMTGGIEFSDEIAFISPINGKIAKLCLSLNSKTNSFKSVTFQIYVNNKPLHNSKVIFNNSRTEIKTISPYTINTLDRIVLRSTTSYQDNTIMVSGSLLIKLN